MKPLFEDLRGFGPRTRALCIFVIALALLVLAASVARILQGPVASQFMLVAFAAIIAFFTGSRPVRLPGTKAVVSVSESIIFLAAILLGPYHAAALGLIDALAGSRKLAKKQVYVVINMSVLSLSAFASACVYRFAYSQLERNTLLGYEQQTLELIVMPLLALAASHYVANIGLMALLSNVLGTGSFFRLWRETFPWIPTTYLAGAAAAGITAYTLSRYTIEATLLVMVLALPIPLIIYYTFKTYHAKLDDERRHLEQMNEVHRSTLEALAMAIDAKDQTTHKHIRRVQVYASRLGELVGMTERELKALEAASLLHDIGKLGVPDYILNKPGKLTAAEFEKMKIHPVVGAEILSNVKFGFPVATYVRAHHERWDGCGYPDGLAGEEIPLTARIISVVDCFDAVREDRQYRKGMTREEAIELVMRGSGTMYDPAVVGTFITNLPQFEAEIAAYRDVPVPTFGIEPTEQLSDAARHVAPAAGLAEEREPGKTGPLAVLQDQLRSLSDLAQVMIGCRTSEDAVIAFAEKLKAVAPYDLCAITLVAPGAGDNVVVHAAGYHWALLKGRTVALGEGVTGWVIANRKPFCNTDPKLDLPPQFAEHFDGYRTLAAFPVVKDREVHGAVTLYSATLDEYTAEHQRVLKEAVALLASVLSTISNAEESDRRDVGLGSIEIEAAAMESELAH